MRPSLAEAFRRIGGAAPEGVDDWWLIGSAAMVLAGFDDVEPEDVDILASSATVLRFLERWGIEPGEQRPGEKFRSFPYRRIRLPGCTDIEVMGDLEVLSDGIWRHVLPRTRRRVLFDGVALFVPEAAEQAEIMRLFGRPKDLSRVEVLERQDISSKA